VNDLLNSHARQIIFRDIAEFRPLSVSTPQIRFIVDGCRKIDLMNETDYRLNDFLVVLTLVAGDIAFQTPTASRCKTYLQLVYEDRTVFATVPMFAALPILHAFLNGFKNRASKLFATQSSRDFMSG